MGSSLALQGHFAVTLVIKMFFLRFLGRGEVCFAVLPHLSLTPPKESFFLQEQAAAGRKRASFEVRCTVTEQPRLVLSIATEAAKYLYF